MPQYADKNSFQTYIDFMAIKRHFTTESYDYHKYNGKVRAVFENFEVRKDVFFYSKLSKKKEYHEIILSNIIKNQNIWIRDLCDEDAFDRYIEWKKTMDSLSYVFKENMNEMKNVFQDNFIVPKNEYPHLLNLYLKRKISLESFSILMRVSNVTDYWEKEITDKILAKDIIRLSKKYYPFLEIDEKKYKEFVKEKFFAKSDV